MQDTTDTSEEKKEPLSIEISKNNEEEIKVILLVLQFGSGKETEAFIVKQLTGLVISI